MSNAQFVEGPWFQCRGWFNKIFNGLSEYPFKRILNFKGLSVGQSERYPLLQNERKGPPLLQENVFGIRAQCICMELDESESTDADASANPQMQMIGKIVNYGLMILGAVTIIYFIATGDILGLSWEFVEQSNLIEREG